MNSRGDTPSTITIPPAILVGLDPDGARTDAGQIALLVSHLDRHVLRRSIADHTNYRNAFRAVSIAAISASSAARRRVRSAR